MIPRRFLLALVPLLAPASPTFAQMVSSVPKQGLSPLLFIRFIGPAGLRATFYQGQPRGRAFNAPVVVGMRPGYPYRIQFNRLPGLPGVSIYPTIEVRGSLHLPPRLSAAAYPAPVVLTDADIASVLAGNLITKVVYLENPDRAIPTTTPPTSPFELDLPPGSHLLREAFDRGRPMLILRLGGRLLVSDDELTQASTPGTILLPGERAMPRAARPPCLLGDGRAFVDPLWGPKRPEEECLHDGGDRGIRAGYDASGNLAGVEPEDTVAEYTDSYGRRAVTHSNRICLCVPRFAVLRMETPLGGYNGVTAVSDSRQVQAQQPLNGGTPPLQTRKYEQLQGANGRERPSLNLGVTVAGQVERREVLIAVDVPLGPIALLGTKAAQRLTESERTRLLRQLELARQLSNRTALESNKQVVVTAVTGRVEPGARMVQSEVETRDLTVCCNEVPCPPDRPLVLIKCADRQSAGVGDVVTFMLKYSNHGGRPISDVTVTDSLATRLEYVPGSAQSDRAAVFTMQGNEAGSLVLRWEIIGKLLPGESGVVRFQARIR